MRCDRPRNTSGSKPSTSILQNAGSPNCSTALSSVVTTTCSPSNAPPSTASAARGRTTTTTCLTVGWTRYKGRISQKAIEREFPHVVEIAVPPGGLGAQLDAMHYFHRARGIEACLGLGSRDEGHDYLRWYFTRPAAANAFCGRVRGQSNKVPRKAVIGFQGGVAAQAVIHDCGGLSEIRSGVLVRRRQSQLMSAIAPKANKLLRCGECPLIVKSRHGRAVQVGLRRSTNERAASMYQASDVEHARSGPSWVSARIQG